MWKIAAILIGMSAQAHAVPIAGFFMERDGVTYNGTYEIYQPAAVVPNSTYGWTAGAFDLTIWDGFQFFTGNPFGKPWITTGPTGEFVSFATDVGMQSGSLIVSLNATDFTFATNQGDSGQWGWIPATGISAPPVALLLVAGVMFMAVRRGG